MSSAMGVLMWSPDTFWRATLYEYTAAMKGMLTSKGVDLSPPVDVEEIRELEKLHDERLRKARMRGHQG